MKNCFYLIKREFFQRLAKNFYFIFIEKNSHSNFSWSPLTTWPRDALVRHTKGLFRALENQNTATPGDKHHSRFYVNIYLFIKYRWL